MPEEILNNGKPDDTIYFFLLYLTSKNPYETKIRPEIINVPLINYYWYFFGKEDEIRRLENKEELQEDWNLSEHISRRSKAIKKIVPAWKELKTQKEAEALCQSLETWAKDYNLNADWFLDFALGILRAFKSSFDFKLSMNKITDLSLTPVRFWRVNFELAVRDSITQAISEYWSDEVWINKWFGFDDLNELPAFEYRWKDFKLAPLTWLPRMSSRKGFVEEMREKLQATINYLHNAQLHWNYYSDNNQLNHLLERCRARLNNYCSEIEKQVSENTNEAVFPPFEYDDSVKTRWIPSKQNREQFVEENIVELKIRIININKAFESCKTFTKRDFQSKLTDYCNEIEKSLPENWKKTPQKYSENKHFEWLVDFQVAPCKSYTQIAKENEVDIKTVREAVQNLAKTIGILLRKANRTGRTKGAKNSEKSNRQLGIYS